MQQKKGFRIRVLLVAAMALVIVSVTLASLWLVRNRLLVQITDDLSKDLRHSVLTFQNLQAQRLNALERENALLADLPSLKALMTTSDLRTIEDGGTEFWRVSGNDLFALGDNRGRVVAAYIGESHSDAVLRANLQVLLTTPAVHYLVTEGRLYACSVQPIYFGSEKSGTLLGYVISGYAIEHTMVRAISQDTAVEVAFVGNGRTLASTLPASLSNALMAKALPVSRDPTSAVSLKLGSDRYLAASQDLSSSATAPLQLVVLKSFDPAEESIRQIDRLVLLAGLLALLLGTVLMIALSRAVTRPLEELAAGVRAFGVGDSTHQLPNRGAREVLELSTAFAGMRSEIQHANQALLESERLAIIGRMASSVSHDLRHYLAAVYANAEFLASSPLTETERSEILSDIHLAVHGTTELIESMLIFSRTGSATRRSHVLMSSLLERAMALVRIHPDADNITLTARFDDPADTVALLDEKQIERAIYNLLLNACQSVRNATVAPEVTATLEVVGKYIVLEVVDNGEGVPENIRTSLFQPFVSEGKQKGSGLGLTLAHCIAIEHGGQVVLVSSRPGETIFRMSVVHGVLREESSVGKNRKRVVTE
ncbi:MAG TPA: ATP-binding protein [Terracidiphilus sp.]|jgi:signal transduction histidine kinase|nr:ATP-binding protein [Terracidiphilus sp.]